jgi:hypothetical protein
MKHKEKLLSLLYQFKDLGIEQTKNDVILIGKANFVGNNAWLNKIYPTLSTEDCNNLELQIKTNLPLEYKIFLTQYSNGLNVLLSTFSLYGLRKEIGRSVDGSRQPYSIITPNLFERPTNSKDSFFFIGGYNWDGSHLYIDKETNKVHFCARWDATSLLSWNSLEDMLLSEIERIYKLFDRDGRELDENNPTTPDLK